MLAAFGIQSAAGASSRGLDHLLRPGLGPEGHMAKALKLDSPFSREHEPEDDIRFAVETFAAWGPFIENWRLQQVKSVKSLASALAPLDEQLVAMTKPSVKAVLQERKQATMAAATVLLR